MSLEQTLADWRGQAAILRTRGHGLQATTIEEVCDTVARAAEEYLTWLSETEACLRSGRSAKWLRGRFLEWERGGHARRKGRHREYRMVILPREANVIAAREAARAAARGAA